MSPRPSVSEERKNQILDAAIAVFARRGFYKARMEDIAREASLSKGALYWYFESKDGIILALLHRVFERELADLQELQNLEQPATDRLNWFVDRSLEDIKQWMQVVPIIYEFLGLVFRQQAVREAFRTYFRSYRELITPIIQQGIDAGEFKALDAEEIALSAGAIFEGTFLLWAYDPEVVDVEHQIRSGIQMLMEGILA